MPETARYTLPIVPGDATEPVAARLWAAGALGVWEQPDTLVAWFPSAAAPVPPGGTWTVEEDRDWQAEWKAGIEPVRAGRVLVVPSWLADAGAAEDVVRIVIDPGQAFGTGHHATTVLCLELLQEVGVAGRRVLDVGTGTGVLAIAALRLGASPAVGVDVDADAVAVATDNAARNGVPLTVSRGSVGAAGDEPADVVVANLLTDTVADLAVPLLRATRPGGWLIASGITVERRAAALAPLRAAGLTVERTRERDGWLALAGRRP